jgi:hypothetical protein
LRRRLIEFASSSYRSGRKYIVVIYAAPSGSIYLLLCLGSAGMPLIRLYRQRQLLGSVCARLNVVAAEQAMGSSITPPNIRFDIFRICRGLRQTKLGRVVIHFSDIQGAVLLY